MNFFKSVFSVDPDPSDSSSEEKSFYESSSKTQENEEGEEETHATMGDDTNPINNPDIKSNTPWVGFGALIKTFASKSESVIQTYRRDLEEFSSGLKKETEAIREVASRAVRDLPYSLEAGASAAQESLESVGQAIDDFGGSVWRGTTEIISEGKDALLAVDSDADTHSSDLQTTSSGGVSASASKRYSRFEVQVLAMQSDPSTFTEGPEDVEDFRKWMSEFKLEEKEDEVEVLCYENGILEGLFEKLVPSVVDYDTFWKRYFYKLYKLKQAEDVRANLVKRVISREEEDEDLTWEVDDDEDECKEEKAIEKDDEEESKKGKALEKDDDEESKEERATEKDDERQRIEDIKTADEAKVENKIESKSAYVEEWKELDLGNEASNSEHVEESNEKGDAKSIEWANEREPVGSPKAMSMEVTTAVDDEMVATSSGEVVSTEPAINSSGDNVVPKASSELVESLKDSDISIISSQTSMPEEEDLGWDEIDDLGEHDDKKVGGSNSTMTGKFLHERLNVADDDDDLTWDIEDDD